MKDQVLLLMKLQEVDSRRSQHQIDEKALPERLHIAEQVLQKKRDEFAQLQTKSGNLDKGKRDKEMDLKVQEEQIVKLRDRLIKLKTNEEYKANLKEIENAKVRKGELEESLLVAMEEGEILKTEIAAGSQGMISAEQAFQTEKQNIEEAVNTLAVTAKAIASEWVSISEMSDKNILADYQQLIVKRKGLAVVPLTGNTCGGCHFSLPPQLIAQVKTGEKILTCTYCHRMLYSPAKIE